MTIKGLDASQSETLRQTLLQRESSGNYKAVNQFGFIGGYQMGAAALEDLGLVKKGASKAGNSALNNPNNWTIPGGKEAFLNNTQLQDQSFERLANINHQRLTRAGVLTGSTSAGDVAGYLGASHLTGSGGAAKLARGEVAVDGNGVKSSEYFALAKSRVTGSQTGPLVTVPGNKFPITAKLPTAVAGALPKPFDGNTGIGDVVQVSGIQEIGSESMTPLGPVINPLEQFSSFNTIFTLSCLSSKQVNFPDSSGSYKTGELGEIILRSGGGYPENRVKTAYKSASNAMGKFEYYIDNVDIDAIMAFNKKTKGTNSTNITFEVFEPYSMGVFLQSLQLAAVTAGYKNYIEAPFLLTIEFIGFDSAGNSVPVTDVLNRHIPLKISNATLEVSASGCKYNVEAYPWNEQALTDMHNLLKEDMNIAGENVSEILQSGKNSLQFWINSALQEIAKTASDTGKSKATPDEVVIIFPKVTDSASSALGTGTKTDDAPLTQNTKDSAKSTAVQSKLTLERGDNALLVQGTDTLNDIGASSMGFTVDTGGDSQPAEDNAIQSDPSKPAVRNSNFYDTTKKSFRFPQNTSIVNAITEVLLMSEYCKTAPVAPSNKKGMKTWFRIETQVYNLEPTATNDSLGKIPKLMVFKVVPYYVHEHRFAAPTNKPKGFDQLAKEVAKEYNYIYTGKNVDILNFNIKLDAGFYTTIYSDKNSKAGQLLGQTKGQGAPDGAKAAPNQAVDAAAGVEPGNAVAQSGSQATRDKQSGGGPTDDYRSLVAKNFQEALLNSPADLITGELEIWGDPYFIADSGMGNFSDKPANFNINKNGSMNYQSGEVDILINFRTPVDYDPSTGYMDFGTAVKVEGFSGLYQVLTVKNKFSSGKFTQTLDLVRRRNQGVKPDSAENPLGSVQGAVGSIQGAVGAIQGAVQGVVGQVQSVAQGAVNQVQGAVANVVQNASGAVQGVAQGVINSAKLSTQKVDILSADEAKPLAVDPNKSAIVATDATQKGNTVEQVTYDTTNAYDAYWG